MQNSECLYLRPQERVILDRAKHIGKSELVKTSGLVLFFKLGTIGLNYAFFLFLSKKFGAAEVGYFALSFTIIQMLSLLGKSGLDIGLFKEISEGLSPVQHLVKNHRKSILYVLSLSIVLVLGLNVAERFLPFSLFATKETSNYVLLFSLSVPLYAIMFFNSEIHRARKRFALFSIFQNFGFYAIMSLYILIRFLFWEWNFDQLVWLFLGAIFILALLSFVGTFNYSNTDEEEHKKSNRNYDFKRLFQTSWPIGIATLGFFLMRWLDGVVLAQFYPEDVVGQYAIAYRIALLGSFVILSINSALGPRITGYYANGDKEKIISETRKSTKFGFWVTFPVILITFLFPEFILGLFGEEFIAAYPAMLILLAGQFMNTIIGPNGIVLQLTGHQRTFKNIVLFTVIFNILINYLIIPRYGIIGAAVVNSASIAIWKIWSLFVVKKIYGRTFFYLPLISR